MLHDLRGELNFSPRSSARPLSSVHMHRFGRRQFLAALGSAGLTGLPGSLGGQGSSTPSGGRFVLRRDDDALLETWSGGPSRASGSRATPRRARCGTGRARTTTHPQQSIGSIAATGFGLTALCVAAGRGWAPRVEVTARVRTILRFLANGMPHERGWFYHFVNTGTGAREWKCELSSIDTALLLAGVLAARQCFADDTGIVRDATAVYERVDFPWMLNGHPHLLSMGWKPETGFLDARWSHYCELMILCLLGIAHRAIHCRPPPDTPGTVP